MSKQGPLSNQRLGNKYLLKELLGVGGFGAVYAAHNERLNRTQAIKVVASQVLDDPKWRERFIREAQMLAALEHTNIIPVYDFDIDVEKDILYLVMPFIDGGTLEQTLKEQAGPLSLQETEHYLQQICSALDYAHAKGTVHLDLKPANLLRRRDEETLLLSDFGLAHLIKEGEIEGGTSLNFGTPYYMAPEQFKGQPQRATDIYALGVILFRMLTGEFPYTGSSVVVDHLQAPIPLVSTMRPDLPAQLDRIIKRALAKEPDERFQSAGALLTSFQSVVALSTSQPAAQPVTPPVERMLYTVEVLDEPISEPLEQRVEEVSEGDIQPAQPLGADQGRRNKEEFQQLLPTEKILSRSLSPLQKSILAVRRKLFLAKVYAGTSFVIVGVFPLLFLIGLGIVTNFYSQSLSTTGVTLSGGASLGYLLAYRKTLSVFAFLLVTIASGVVVYLLSLSGWFIPPNLQLSALVTDSSWLFTTRDFWPGRQINAGFVCGIISSFLVYSAVLFFLEDGDDLLDLFFPSCIAILLGLLISAGIWLVASVASAFFNWGFGFGTGWNLGLLWLLVGFVVGPGLADFIHILFRKFD